MQESALHLNGRRILVAGGAGFIGSHTVDALVKAGAKVCVIDNLLTGRLDNLNQQEVSFYEMSVANSDVAKVFREFKPEFVYDFAFNVCVPKSLEDPAFDIEGVIGCINLLRNSAACGIQKFIFASSAFIYGNTSKIPTPESEPLDPVSPYAIAKYSCENYVKFFKAAHHLPYIIFRYATTYGPRQVMGAMADYIRKLKGGEQAEFWGDSKSKTRDYIFVDDVVRANIMALDFHRDNIESIFNIGTNRETTLYDLYVSIARILGKEAKPIGHPERAGEQLRFCLDTTKAKTYLQWEPLLDINDGLAKTVFK